MYGTLTVGEVVRFSSEMRIKDRGDAMLHAEAVLKAFGLTGVSESLIGGDGGKRGISGGERRRTSVAAELVAEPRIVFLDEPTSGLDAFNALLLAQTLKEYAQCGIGAFDPELLLPHPSSRNLNTVLMTIHQPQLDILELFDRIILMARGRIVFFGSLPEAAAHFASLGLVCPERAINPADFYMSLLTEDPRDLPKSRETISRVIEGPFAAPMQQPACDPPRTDNHDFDDDGTFAQPQGRRFWLLLQRNFWLTVRARGDIAAQVGTTFITALFLAFVFFRLGTDFASVQSRIGLLYFVTVNALFTVFQPLLVAFAFDKRVITREWYVRAYGSTEAFFARLVVLVPPRLALYTCTSLMIYFVTGLRLDSFAHVLAYWAVLMAVVFAATTFAMFVSGLAPTIQIAQTLGTLLLVVSLLFAGNLANASGVTWVLRWIQYISLPFYSFQALIQNELAGLYLPVAGRSGQSYLAQFYLNQLPAVAAGLAVLGWAFLFMLAGLLALSWSTRPRLHLP